MIVMICKHSLVTPTNLEALELHPCFRRTWLAFVGWHVRWTSERPEQLHVTALWSLVNLKTFRLPCNCTDNVIMSVGCSCRNMKCTDFHCSPVTNMSVGSNVDLQYLLKVNNNNLFNIPEIHQSGYRTCQQITINMVQNECWQ
jgi:hypothetical protein